MPPIVIDLLSSPDLPVRPINSKATVLSSKTAPKRVLNYEPAQSDNDGWHALSSDDYSDIFAPPKPFTKPSKPAIPAPPKSKSSTAHEPRPSIDEELAKELQAEWDNEDIIAPRASTSIPALGGNDFFYLDDDFDSTVNLDDSLPLNAPVAKKRRLTPSPKSRPAKAPREAGYKRSSSNVDPPSKSAGPRVSAGLKRAKTTSAILESDPITFTSSPDPFAEAARRKKDKGKELAILDEDDDDDPFMDLDQAPNKKAGISSENTKASTALGKFDLEDSSDVELPDIGDITARSMSRASQIVAKDSKAVKDLQKKTSSKAPNKNLDEAARGLKAAEKEAEKERKRIAKEAEKERKRIEKEEKAAQKEREADTAKLNTLRTDKKVSAPEMIVDLPSCLDVKLVSHVKTFLDTLQVEHSRWESNVEPIIKWRRKVEARYDKDAGQYVRCPKHIKDEDHVMYVMLAQEFVDLATGEEGKDLEAHCLRLKAKFLNRTIIYLIEGLVPWMRKNKGVKNRAFVAAVRGEEQPAPSQRRPKNPQPEYVDEELLEGALLRLQVMHKPLIHHTNVTIESGKWVVAFTQHISTIPYRLQRDSLDTTFSMESGQVKTGEDAADTFIKMLSEVKMLTSPVAYGIAAEYPTIPKLVAALRSKDKDKGPLALQDCKKSANKDGALTDRRVGPAISKRVHKIFTSRDESEIV